MLKKNVILKNKINFPRFNQYNKQNNFNYTDLFGFFPG